MKEDSGIWLATPEDVFPNGVPPMTSVAFTMTLMHCVGQYDAHGRDFNMMPTAFFTGRLREGLTLMEQVLLGKGHRH